MVEAIHAHLLSALPLTPIDAAKELEALGFYWCIMGHGASLSGTEVAPPYFHHKQLKPGEHWRQSMRKRHMRVANKLAMRNEPLAGIPSDVWSLLTTANISGKLTPKQERILKHSGAVVDHILLAMQTDGVQCEQPYQKRTDWSAQEEDALLDYVAHQPHATLGGCAIAGRSTRAKYLHLQYLLNSDKTSPALTAAREARTSERRARHAHITFNANAPPQPLSHETWAPIEPTASLPDNAEVDWWNGVARIPMEWRLAIPTSHFKLAGVDCSPLEGLEYEVEDVTASTKVGDLLLHLHAWLRHRLPEATMPPLMLLAVQPGSASMSQPGADAAGKCTLMHSRTTLTP